MATNKTKKGLGRGLSSLMGDTETTQTKNTNIYKIQCCAIVKALFVGGKNRRRLPQT